MDDFVIWGSAYSEGSCVIEKPENFEEPYLLTDGVKLSDQWPKDVVCRMDSDYPKDVRLTDNLHGANCPVISHRLRDRISVLVTGVDLEFLPVTVLNHKGRVASKDYCCLNPVGTVDCIDIKKSQLVWNAINKNVISSIDELSLKNGAIPKNVSLFRPTYLTRAIFLRRVVSEALSGEGFTGLMFQELAQYQG